VNEIMDLQKKIEELERKNRELEVTLKDREAKTLQVKLFLAQRH
jgi:hypothetical protein